MAVRWQGWGCFDRVLALVPAGVRGYSSGVSSSSENGQHLRVLFFFDKPVTFFFVAVSCVCGLCVWIHLTLVLRVMKFVDTLFFAKEIESVMMTSSRSSSRCVRCAGPREMDP